MSCDADNRLSHHTREDEQSKVRATLGGMRHRTVHHALKAAADADARILVNHKKGWLHHEWPETVALRSLLGDVTTPDAQEAFVERAKLAQEIFNASWRL